MRPPLRPPFSDIDRPASAAPNTRFGATSLSSANFLYFSASTFLVSPTFRQRVLSDVRDWCYRKGTGLRLFFPFTNPLSLYIRHFRSYRRVILLQIFFNPRLVLCCMGQRFLSSPLFFFYLTIARRIVHHFYISSQFPPFLRR